MKQPKYFFPAFFVSCAAAFPFEAFAAEDQSAEHGALLYYQYGCYQCHGFSGYGQRDLNNAGSPYLANEDVFRAFLRGRQNVAPLFPSTSMPNYPENSLSDDQVSAIYAYIGSFPVSDPEVADEPALQAILESAEQAYRP